MITGGLLINKECGKTSRQEVNEVSHLLHEKKIGHIGTLDPFADGLLIVLVGRATKLAPFLEGLDKTYLGTLKLGQKTDTADRDGKVVEEQPVPTLNVGQIREILQQFTGDLEQIPPKYSALKVDGERAYALARKNVEFELQKRQIHIFENTLINFNGSDEITFLCRVSKGTYVRTLGEDIAVKLGTVGHLTALSRVKTGEYSIEQSHKSKDVKEEYLISVDDLLKSYPSEILQGGDIKKASNGMRMELKKHSEKLVLLKDSDGPIAMYERVQGHFYYCLRGLR